MKSLTLAALLVANIACAQEYKWPSESEADRKPVTQTGGTCLIKASRVITVSGETLKDAEIYVRNGKIEKIGTNLSVPRETKVLDLKGKVIMPGIVDAHVHRGSDATNEGSDSIVSEVRIEDVLDSTKLNIWQAVASGETTALVLHGSANPVGGESIIIKLKYKRPNNELPFPGAHRVIKFALGENVTRMSSATSTRFPNSRMGVEATYRRAFIQAREYQAEWDRWNTLRAGAPPRKDLRLQTLADILSQKVWVTCHSYRADEILMLARLSKEFGFKICTFQHALEAYKVAPELAEMGIPVSMFSDHWSYKLEAYDAIPAGPAICHKAGVLTSINTDGTGGITTVIYDAAKLMREGNLTENEALRTVTLNPAKQLGVDKQVGSIEVGKDADFAIYDGHPFSTASKCVMTLIDGEVFFERVDKFGVGTSKESNLDLPTPRSNGVMRVPKISKSYALVGGTVHPISGPAIKNGTVLISQGKIVAVGASVAIPSGTQTINVRGQEVYPGMFDSGTAMGLSEISPIPVTIDLNESGDYQADLVASTAVQRESAHFGYSLTHGILNTLTRPGGSLFCGQGSLLNTWGWTNESMTVRRESALVVNVPAIGGGGRRRPADQDACACFGPTLQELWDGVPHDHEAVIEPQQDPQPNAQQEFAGRMKALGDYLDQALVYAQKKRRGQVEKEDPGLDAMVPYVEGKLPVILRVSSITAIRNAISLCKKYRLKGILSGANDAWRIADEVKASGLPVLVTAAGESTLGGTTSTSQYDPYDTPFVLVSMLQKAGIVYAMQSEDNAMSFLLPIKTGMCRAFGSQTDDLMRALTLNPAKILGVENELGSLEAGKRATLIVTNGNPLESTTTVTLAFVDGRPVNLEGKNTVMRDKYMQRLAE